MGGKQSKSKYVINQEIDLDENQYQSQFARLRRSFRKRKTHIRNETSNHSHTENARSRSVLVKYGEQKKLSKSLSLPNNYKPSKVRREYDFQEDHIDFGDDDFENDMFVKSISLPNGTKINEKQNEQPTLELNYCTPLPDTVYLPPKSSSNDRNTENHQESLKSSKAMSAKQHQWRPFSSQKYRLDVERSHVAKGNVMLRTASHYTSKSTRKDKSKSKVTFKDSNDYLLIDRRERQNGYHIFPAIKKKNSGVKMMLSVTQTNDKPYVGHSRAKSNGIEKHKESKRQSEFLLSHTNNNNNNFYSDKMINISNERNLHNAKINYLDRSSNERTETRPNRATRHSLSHNREDVLLRKDGKVEAFRHSSPPAAEEYVFVSYAQQDKISLRKTQSSTFYQEI